MMKRNLIYGLLATVLIMVACGRKDADKTDENAIDVSRKLPGDKLIYGLACDGCSDSAVVFLPNEGGDPVTYNIVRAMRNKQVFGHPEIGDWVALLPNPDKKNEALMVIDLDQLKGTWTYQVMPTLKESAIRTEKQINAELTDSMRELLFVPREYGFTLKRHQQATSVGRVFRANSLSDESIVEYPPVTRYTEWRVFNGKLILTMDTLDATMQRLPEKDIQRDTAEFVFMMGDTLALRMNGAVIGLHRQKNAEEANKKANEAAIKLAAKDTIK